ncbi:MAG TPA: ABC transporter substrate-binding protein [Fimbriimonas sp.]|nr:ABC transporter substrate-binding protein [Fimbriimonas sp.]
MRRAICLSILASVLLAGCSDHFQTVKYAPAIKQKAIVSLSPSATEIMASVLGLTSIVGRTASDDYPPTILSKTVVASVKPDYEKIKSMSPDLVVYDDQLYNASDVAKIKEIGAPTFAITGNTVDDFEKCLLAMGDVTLTQTGMNDYILRIDDAKKISLADKLPSKPRVAVIIPGHGGASMVAGTKSFIADVVRIAGGEPVGPAQDHFVPADPESLISFNPDIIIMPTSQKTKEADLSSILNDPRLKNTNAVKSNKVKGFDEDIVERRGARVDSFITNAHKLIGSEAGS